MIIEIKVPQAGESITQVELARWMVADGDYVEKDQEIAEIDSDKATLTINADDSGVIKISMEEGESTEPGKVIATIDTSADKPTGKGKPDEEKPEGQDKPDEKDKSEGKDKPEGKDRPEGNRTAATDPIKEEREPDKADTTGDQATPGLTISPRARKLLEELEINPRDISIHAEGTRITKKDVLAAIAYEYHHPGRTSGGISPREAASNGAGCRETNKPEGTTSEIIAFTGSWGGTRDEERRKLSTLRKKIAERLVAVKNQTAMLTTFNEVDMSAIIELRRKHQDAFRETYGHKLGFMSFFVKAIAESIPFFPEVNGYIEGHEIVIPSFADVGVAVSTPKGLMVPVIRNAESMSFPEVEARINELARKARDNKISLEELKGGTISITNGGVFGSMLSTPILNPPQSAILGMHNIIDRPVAIGGRVEIRPMMFLALSYDHRVIDGKESVGFLVKVKEMIEDPVRLLFGGKDPMGKLLGI